MISATVSSASAQQLQFSDAQGKAPPTSDQGSGNSTEVEMIVLSVSSSTAQWQTPARHTSVFHSCLFPFRLNSDSHALLEHQKHFLWWSRHAKAVA